MTRNTWHILRDGPVLTVARRLPVRFDLSVKTLLPEASRLGIAQQVRQDLWRALQMLRGFSPVVQVARTQHGLEVTAGGQVDGAFPQKKAEALIAALLNDPGNRARWISWAR